MNEIANNNTGAQFECVQFVTTSPYTAQQARVDLRGNLLWFVALTLICFYALCTLGLVRKHALLVSLVSVSLIAVFNRIGRTLLSRQRRSKSPLSLKAVPDQSSRLVYVGYSCDFERFGPLLDVAFEPIFFSGLRAHSLKHRFLLEALILTIPSAVFLYFPIAILLREKIALPVSISGVTVSHMVAVAFSSTLGAMIVDQVRQVIARITPGKLEIMFRKPFSLDLFCLRAFDLTQSKIIADPRQNAIFIVERNSKACAASELPIRGIRDKHLFIFNIFRAAITSYRPPGLPQDAFLG